MNLIRILVLLGAISSTFAASPAEFISAVKTACEKRNLATIESLHHVLASDKSNKGIDLQTWTMMFHDLDSGWQIGNLSYLSPEQLAVKDPVTAKFYSSNPILIPGKAYKLNLPISGFLLIKRISKDKSQSLENILPVGITSYSQYRFVYPIFE